MKVPHIDFNKLPRQEPDDRASVPFGCVPLLIEGLVSEWDATTIWTREHLTRMFGSAEVVCYVSSAQDHRFLQQVNKPVTLSFRDFLEHVYKDTDDYLLYLRIDTEHELFDALSKDFEIPELLDRYNPSATGVWIGEKGNVTPFHHDWWHSFLAQISGRKRYILVHPFEGATLQSEWSQAAVYDLSPAPYMPPDDPLIDQFETCFQGILEPGQMLYIPPYWFHQVETLDNGNISMPIRFDTPQSPDVPIYQFGQGTTLRELTNQPVKDEDRLEDVLESNRRLFHRREREFIEAFVETRGLDSRVRKIIDDLEAATA